MQPNHAGLRLEAVEDDVAAVLGHGRADAGVEQVLDLGDDLGGVALVDASSSWPSRLAVEQQRLRRR